MAAVRKSERLRSARSAYVLEFIGSEWMTCHQIMRACGLSWQLVSRHLKRLVAQGDVEVGERIEIASRSRVRHIRIYRRRPEALKLQAAPRWFAAAAGFSKS